MLALPRLGFRVATFLYVAARGRAARAAARREALADASSLLALLTAAITYFVFERYLSVLLPRGRWTGF